MPITFKSKHSPDILMLDAVGLSLLKLMGHSATVPGSLAAQDIAAALSHLQAAVSAAPTQVLEVDRHKDQDQRESDQSDQDVNLAQRAGPLIAMLKTALSNGEYVIWER